MKEIYKRSVLVVGGSRGIGAETVKLFSQKGYDVAFTFNKSEDAADRIRRQTGAIPLRADAGHSDSAKISVERAVANLGHIDVLVCNAGISHFGLISDISEEMWEKVIATNLSSIFYYAKYVTPAMISRKSGCIINVASMWGEVGASCEVAYSASKAGVIGFTKALAKELGPSGIRVNCVSPGLIDTDMNNQLGDSVIKEIVAETPIERIGKASDVAKAIMYLSSDESSFITGQVLDVNGGLVI